MAIEQDIQRNMTIEQDIQRNVNRLKNHAHFPKECVIKDYSINDITIKNVPFIKNEPSYLLSGKNLDCLLSLLLENERTGKNSKSIAC